MRRPTEALCFVNSEKCTDAHAKDLCYCANLRLLNQTTPLSNHHQHLINMDGSFVRLVGLEIIHSSNRVCTTAAWNKEQLDSHTTSHPKDKFPDGEWRKGTNGHIGSWITRERGSDLQDSPCIPVWTCLWSNEHGAAWSGLTRLVKGWIWCPSLPSCEGAQFISRGPLVDSGYQSMQYRSTTIHSWKKLQNSSCSLSSHLDLQSFLSNFCIVCLHVQIITLFILCA